MIDGATHHACFKTKVGLQDLHGLQHSSCSLVHCWSVETYSVRGCSMCRFTYFAVLWLSGRSIIIRLCSGLVVEVSYTSMNAIICLTMCLGVPSAEDIIFFLGMYYV